MNFLLTSADGTGHNSPKKTFPGNFGHCIDLLPKTHFRCISHSLIIIVKLVKDKLLLARGFKINLFTIILWCYSFSRNV